MTCRPTISVDLLAEGKRVTVEDFDIGTDCYRPLRRLTLVMAMIYLILPEGRAGEVKLAEAGRTSGVASKPVVVRQWPTVEAFLESGERACVERLRKETIRRDIREAAALAVHSLAEHMNRDRAWRPPLGDPANRQSVPPAAGALPELYWGADRLADGTGRFAPITRRHPLDTGVAHVIGRALWAMLLAEETMGIPAPAESLDVLTRYCREAYDNPDHLALFVDPVNGFRRSIICHDQREGFLGLLALARVRHDRWAKEELARVLASLEKITDQQGHLSAEKAKQAGLQATLLGAGNDATTSGRLVEPLVEYCQFSPDPRVLRLAERYARTTLESTFDSEGRFRPMARSGGHIHSITSSLCGIVRYAIAANDRALLKRTRGILDAGVAEYASSWGWVDEVMPEHPANEIGRGEINQTGDVIRCALLLGEAGYPEYYELAERYLRSGLLPVQHRAEDLSRFLRPTPSAAGDWERDVASRVVGGYSMFLPNDRMQPGAWPLTTQDIISGAVHALSACWRHRSTTDGQTVRVNLLLDYDGPDLAVRSGLPLAGRLCLLLKTGKPAMVRVPTWVDPCTLRAVVDGKSRSTAVTAGYLILRPDRPGSEAVVEFAVPCHVERAMVDGTCYTSTWIGNQVVEILPRGSVSPLPF